MSIENEWKMATENAVHFNDLLMRIRTLGLPMVITIVGAGAGLLGTKLSISLMAGVVNSIGLILGLVLLIFVVIMLLRKNIRQDHIFPIPLYLSERIAWILVPITVIVFFARYLAIDCIIGIGFTQTKIYPVGAFIMLTGLGLMVVLYALDRFYYYELLIGAVTRASELEESLSYELSSRISQSVSQVQATRIITYFYWVPGYCTLFAFLVII